MQTPSSEQWFVAVTAIHCERKAMGAIATLGYQTWLPIEKRRAKRLRNGKAAIVENPLFPRYGFVRFDIASAYGDILACDGVEDLLPAARSPQPVADRIIEGLQLAEEIGVFDHTKPPKVGQRVEIQEGPFSGWLGKIVKSRAGDRVKVLLKLLGGERSVDVPIMALREV